MLRRVAMGFSKEARMRLLLTQKLQPSQLKIANESSKHGWSEESHYNLLIVSPLFEGLPLVKRHQMVYAALSEMLREVHALTLVCRVDKGAADESPQCVHKEMQPTGFELEGDEEELEEGVEDPQDGQDDEENLMEDQDVASSDSQLQVNDPSQVEDNQPEEEDPMRQYYAQEGEVLQWLLNNPSQKWVDKDFPTSSSQFYEDPTILPPWTPNVKALEWRRPEEVSKEARFMQGEEVEARQGLLGASWFLGAVGVLSTRAQILSRLIVEKEGFQKGWVAFQFFKHGKWVQVIVDTLLPFEKEPRLCLYSSCANPNQFWLPLLQKAYSKLHGCYQRICRGSVLDGLVDLSGGLAQFLPLAPQDPWVSLNSMLGQKFVVAAVRVQEEHLPRNPEQGAQGILLNHYYPVMELRQFLKDGLRLVRLRNPWGSEGVWTGPFCEEADDWEKYKAVKEELKHAPRTRKPQGAWWMPFSDFLTYFNKVVITRVFPDSWDSYAIQGTWANKTNGGRCPLPNDRHLPQERTLPQQERTTLQDKPTGQQERNTLIGTQERTTLPQERTALPQDRNTLLAQQERTTQLQQEKTLLEQARGEHAQTVRGEHVQAQSDDRWFNNPQFRLKVNKDTKIYLSLMQQDEKMGVPYCAVGFMVAATRSRSQRFWQRPPQQDIVAEVYSAGGQRELTQQLTLRKGEKGARLYIVVPCIVEPKREETRRFFLRVIASQTVEVSELGQTIETTVEGQWNQASAGGSRRVRGVANANWCRNPQYFVALKQPTLVKVILRRGGAKKFKGWKLGLTVCREQTPALPTPQPHRGKQRAGHNIDRLLQQTKQILQPPNLVNPQRKLLIHPHEVFRQSAYLSQECSALFFRWSPTEGPFILVPSSDGQDRLLPFRLTLYSNHPLELIRLDDSRNQALVGRWEKDISAGGSHLSQKEKEAGKRTWAMNPKYHLTFREAQQGNITLKVHLVVAQRQWKKLNPNTVSSMIGLYLLEKRDGKLAYSEDFVLAQTTFLPVKSTTLEIVLGQQKPINKLGYILMPATYEAKVQGAFILSVKCDAVFDLIQSK